MSKRLIKHITAITMICVLLIGTISTNTVLADSTSEVNVVTSLPEKVEQTPELEEILKECNEVKSAGSSRKIRRGETVSVESVSGRSTKMAIMSNGDLYCWGYNGHIQVGNGSTKDQLTPVKVLSDVKYAYYSALYEPVSAITTNGDLYIWGGFNDYGQLGNGSTEVQLTPVKVLNNVKSFYYDEYCTSAITTNGDLYRWGCNDSGQVGNGSTKDQFKPVKVLSAVKSVYYSSSNNSVSAITTNGDLYCWGFNCYGQVGNESTKDQLTPVKVLGDVKSVSYSYGDSVSAITTNGDLYCWGDNSNGQIGNGTTERQLTPVKVLSDVKSVSYSIPYFLSSVSAIKTNGDLYCWGGNTYGQVGNGTTEVQLTPVKVLGNVEYVQYSFFSVLAITTNGDLYCWGNNGSGQVGNGSTNAKQLTPFKVFFGTSSASPSATPTAKPSVTPSPSPVVPTGNHIFTDYAYTTLASGSAVIYGNGTTLKIDNKKVNNRVFTAYTDITASYKYTLNKKGTVKPSIGKVIVAVTKTDNKPTVDYNKNKITDTSALASDIARAKIKNGQITVTAVGKDGGTVYLWVIDTGSKKVSDCCPINVKLAPKKLEVQNTSGSKLTKTTLENGKTLDVQVAGTVPKSTTATDVTYTATVDSKYQSYVTVTPVDGSKIKFTIKAVGLKGNKDTKVAVTFKCDQNGKKTKFSLTITK